MFSDASDRDVGDAAADAWGYLNGPDYSLAVTNANALSQSQGQDMMNAERQLASSMNPQTQRALNRDQALIYWNNAAYSEFGDVVSGYKGHAL